MKSAERRRIQLLEYLGNPDNIYLNRTDLASTVLGFKSTRFIYKLFSPDELSEIEAEALEIRRKKYANRLAKVDQSLLEQAEGGDVSAAKLAYQRFEGWSERKISEHTGKVDIGSSEPIEITFVHKHPGFDD